MTVREQFEKLRKEWLDAGTEAERNDIDRRIKDLSEENPEEFERAFYEGAREAVDSARTLVLRDRLEPLLPMINLSYIAENYLHRSRSWFSQRLNGATVNGKKAVFSKDDTMTIADALADMAGRLKAVSDSIRPH